VLRLWGKARGKGFREVKRLRNRVDVPDVSTVSPPDFLALSELMQRAAELEVRLDICESERRHVRTTLEAVPMPLIVTTPFDDIAILSEPAAKLFGVDRHDVIGRPLGVLSAGSELADLVRHTRELHSRGERRTCRRMLLTSGGPRMFEITLLCVCEPDDGAPSPWGVVVLFSAQPATVDEETTAPLMLIRSYAELLASDAGDDSELRRRYAQAISTEASRLLAGLSIT
jgi:PAS domain-containing protein